MIEGSASERLKNEFALHFRAAFLLTLALCEHQRKCISEYRGSVCRMQ